MFGISEYEVLGYIHRLKDKDVNIDYYERDGEVYVIKNEHPDLAKEILII